MATQLFEGREHAAVYQKYRFAPGEELKQTILTYLREKRANPAELVVDVGCGSGQGTRFLAEHFKKVVGTDISEAQIQEARDAPSPPNISYLVCPAEELPFKDASVDLLASFTAAHWFDIEKFMREANRVVKPGGCVVISTYTRDMSLRYGNCSEKLTEVFREAWDMLLKYMHSRVKHVLEDYKEIFEAIPFPDKKRITNIFDKIPMTVAGVIGYLESISPYQAFMKSDPVAAKSFLPEIEKSINGMLSTSSRMMQQVTSCDVTPGIASPNCSGMVLAARGTNHPSTVAAAADRTCQEVVKGYEVHSMAGSASRDRASDNC